jgi:hypothetical protein
MRNWEDITDAERQELVITSLPLMRSVTDIYGPEAGMELWSAIADTINDGLKGEIFMGMIGGKYGRTSVMVVKMDTAQYVNAIKAVRNATGLGLKDAKDFCDRVRNGVPEKLECLNSQAVDTLRRDLTQLGCVVS